MPLPARKSFFYGRNKTVLVPSLNWQTPMQSDYSVSRNCQLFRYERVMKKVAIKIEAMRPEVAPIKGDTGGSLKSIASSCSASPPTRQATMACQKPSPVGVNCCALEPNTTRRTSKAIATATNAVTMASQTWFVNTASQHKAHECAD